MRVGSSYADVLHWLYDTSDYMVSVSDGDKVEYWKGRRDAIKVLIDLIPNEIYEVLDVGLNQHLFKIDSTHKYGNIIGAEDLINFKSKWCERIPPLNGHSKFRCRTCLFSYGDGYCCINKFLNQDKEGWEISENSE